MSTTPIRLAGSPLHDYRILAAEEQEQWDDLFVAMVGG
jgi:hypothetical protein